MVLGKKTQTKDKTNNNENIAWVCVYKALHNNSSNNTNIVLDT